MRSPTPNDKYQDKRGQTITVTSNTFNRVTFLRDGYPAECVYPLDRFIKEFTYLEGANHV